MTGWGRRFRDAAGYSLPELLVAAVIGLLVTGAGATMLTTALHGQPERSERAGQIQQGRTMLERVSRELRQGNSVDATSPSSLRIHTYVNSATCGGTPATTAIQCWVTYSCGSTSCTRTEETSSGGGAPVIVASGITGPNVFCFAPWDGQGTCPSPSATDPTYVAMRLVFPAKDGSETVTFDDGVALRNG